MSWSINNTGNKEAVTAAIDGALANQQGMPPAVGAYLKDAVDAIDLQPGCLIRVESSGHRPLGVGAVEVCKVELVKAETEEPAQEP